MTTQRKSSKELKQLFCQREPPGDWEASAWRNEREHAFGDYWRRRLEDHAEPLSPEEVAQVLFYTELETAFGVLGDAARLNLLSLQQCADLVADRELDRFPKATWAKGELELRLVANRLLQETNLDTRRGLLNEVLHQKRYWPLEFILNQLTQDELSYCEQALADRSVLTKNTREQARQAIRRIRKQA